MEHGKFLCSACGCRRAIASGVRNGRRILQEVDDEHGARTRAESRDRNRSGVTRRRCGVARAVYRAGQTSIAAATRWRTSGCWSPGARRSWPFASCWPSSGSPSTASRALTAWRRCWPSSNSRTSAPPRSPRSRRCRAAAPAQGRALARSPLAGRRLRRRAGRLGQAPHRQAAPSPRRRRIGRRRDPAAAPICAGRRLDALPPRDAARRPGAAQPRQHRR